MQSYVEPALTDAEGRALWLALFEELKRRRLLAPAASGALARLALLGALLAAALALAWTAGGALALGAYAALALLLAQFAFAGHDAGHGSLARTAAGNRALGQVAMTLVTGLAFDEWIARHRAHHLHCQDEARDPDLAVDLVVSLTAASRRAKGRVGRFLTRGQAVHVWALSLLFGHSQRLLSQAAALRHPVRHRADAAMLAAHFALWFAVPCAWLGVPVGAAMLAYLAPLTLLGPYLAAIFWVNHVGMPLIREPARFSFFERQVVTSRTLAVPRALDWAFGGLNYQVEHHLFPQVPSRRLREAHSAVRRHFERRGLDYPLSSWAEAARAVARHLRRIAKGA